MTEKQEIKMQLLKEFGTNLYPETVNFCREAYRWLMEDETETAAPGES